MVFTSFVNLYNYQDKWIILVVLLHVYCRTFFVVYVAVFGFHSVLLIYYNKTAENVNDGKR